MGVRAATLGSEPGRSTRPDSPARPSSLRLVKSTVTNQKGKFGSPDPSPTLDLAHCHRMRHRQHGSGHSPTENGARREKREKDDWLI